MKNFLASANKRSEKKCDKEDYDKVREMKCPRARFLHKYLGRTDRTADTENINLLIYREINAWTCGSIAVDQAQSRHHPLALFFRTIDSSILFVAKYSFSYPLYFLCSASIPFNCRILFNNL